MSARVDVLRDVTPEEIRRLVVGYESDKRYEISRDVSPQSFRISLDLLDLDATFVKRWTVTDPMASWYRGLLADGMSFGAWNGDDLVGLALTQRSWNDVATVWELHVTESHRRQGLGRALLEAVESAAVRSGMRAVSIETQTSNVDAISFYRACGYELSAVDLAFYTNDDVSNGEVAVFMAKHLT